MRVIAAVVALVALCVTPAGAAPGATPARQDHPSILLLTVDTLRPDHLPFHGYGRDTAPFLDSLSRGAVVYRHAFSTSSWTVPAVTSILSGLYPVSHGVTHGSVVKGLVVNQEILAADVPTLAQFMKRQGYATAAVVANSHMNPGTHFDRGFDRYHAYNFAPAESVNVGVRELGDLVNAPDRPFFIWIHYVDPHHPYLPREPWLKTFLPDMTPTEFIEMSKAQARWAEFERLGVKNRARMLQVANAHYDSEIRYMDGKIKELFREFPSLGDALILFTADHGEELMEHGYPTHGRNLYDTTVRVPFFIRPPGGGAPDNVLTAVSLVDVAPTLLVAAGGEPPALWRGSVIWKNGRAAPPSGERMVLAELDHFPKQAIHKAFLGPRWKVIQDIGSGTAELYDRETDPGERTDLARREPTRTGTLLKEMRRFILDLPRTSTTTDPRAMTQEQKELLKSLGYLN